MKRLTLAVIFLLATCVMGESERAQAQLRWPTSKKELLRVRLVALALAAS